MEEINSAWENFINNNCIAKHKKKCKAKQLTNIPKCGDIYISTKTMIAYFNQPIPLYDIFWSLPILSYNSAQNGIVKKQMKINCTNEDEVKKLEQKINEDKNKIISVDILKQIKFKNGTIKYNRKINIGISKKDLTCFKKKKKGAFYNCFVIILRIKFENIFKEIHIKIFNTGKLEIPGIQKTKFLWLSLNILIKFLQPYLVKKISYNINNIETVLINSNFNCGFYINRDNLYHILKYKYNFNVAFDSCSYPGIQCKYYYNNNKKKNNGLCNCSTKCDKKGKGDGDGECFEISFMIFRTGSVLIVGHCEENIIYHIYKNVKQILQAEYNNILIINNEKQKKPKKKKVKKKILIIKKQPICKP